MTLSATTLAGYYCRLHAKLNSPGALFDGSWAEAPISQVDQLQWGLKALELSESETTGLAFDRTTDRFLLLTPGELERIACALGALKNQQSLKFCIDGGRLRQLQSMIGPLGYAEIMRPIDRPPPQNFVAEWSVESLCIDGFKQLMSNAMDMHPITRRFLKVALPSNVSGSPSQGQILDGELPLASLRTWFPELRWLFG